ncbi:extracellular matrix organizing protein FRAS1-like [Neocloeon triangulifer]|uniref:extracellular matrix organizing protein FRAS1-like n=1 Tax=Neocloeon triangulifer TaxID=2078957 RepID=UPI00286FA0E8|nr:extracellular matrix organizing protein FRAS1-like [Neocloeon triangulifer]XP_059478660.1 extracellular matrix organizing protein FRAS1-like [Neocloeon triangulifer]XP_059478661.1 extracellular matrix organizing protein FRAS1-like [Neocloeon triangulifer]XP_059478662.1 extracellular matrix organizing protein FRAS1-like [Neocloeon triangulifer]
MDIQQTYVFLSALLLAYCSAASSFDELPDGPYKLTATADQYVTITERHFPPEGPDPSRDEYAILGPLEVDDSGHFSLRSKPNAIVSEFSQEEIRQKDLVYVPPAAHLVPEKRTVTFSLMKTSPALNQSYPLQFSIVLLPLDQHLDHPGPRFKITNPTITASVDTPTINISRKYFEVEGFGDAHIQFMVIEEPAQGFLTLLHPDGSAAPLTGAEEFSNVLVGQGAIIQYKQTSLGSTLEDTFELMATDSQVEAINRIFLRFTSSSSAEVSSKKMSDRPEVVNLQVSEGQRVVLTSDYFSYALSGGGRRDVTYTLMDSPVYGALVLMMGPRREKELAQGDTFRQDDANQGRLEYRAAPEIGLRAVTDRVPLTISDYTGTRYRPQLLAISIAPEDNQAPIVSVNGDIVVCEGSSETLPQKLISVSDSDSPNQSLVFVLETPPTFGYLESNYKGAIQSPAGQFPFDAFESNSIKYVQAFHMNMEPPRDVLFFHITDGKNRSPSMRLNINIELVNDEIPLIMAETMEVDSSMGTIIKNSSLYVSDFDTPPSQLVLTIIQEPYYGNIQRRISSDRPLRNGAKLAAGDSFSYLDVIEELLFYKPLPDRSSGKTHDSAVFSVTDGDFVSQSSLAFNLTMQKPVESAGSQILELSIDEGGFKAFSKEMLWFNEEKNTHFILLDNLKPGIFLQIKENGKWKNMRQGDHFSFAEIQKGLVRFKHETGFDTKVFIVKVRVERANMFKGNRIFYIKVIENFAAPWLDANTGLEVPFGLTTKVNISQLSAFDLDSEPKELRFKILDEPISGWFEVNGSGRSQQWSQSDLEAGKLKFHHSGKNDIKVENFDFEVTDGRNFVPAKMSIQVKGSKEQASGIPKLLDVRSLKVNQGARVKITQFELLVMDDSATFADLSFDVSQTPEHGRVEIQRSDGFVEEKHFSMLDVLEGRVFYFNQIEKKNSKDKIQLVLIKKGQRIAYIDEVTKATLTVPITLPIEVLEGGGPILLVNSGLDFLERVDDKVSGYLSIRHLDAVSNDTPAKKLTYTVTTPPNFGLLYTTATFPETPTSVFTQDDINAGRIYYQLDSNVDYFQTRDEFTFDITDVSTKSLTGNIFRIQWAWVNFDQPNYNISESSAELFIKIVKNGGFIKDSTSVECTIVDNAIGSAFKDDVQLKHSMVQFDHFDREEYCVLQIKDNRAYQGKKEVIMEIFNPSKTLLGPLHRTQISIYDEEDRPQITFRSRLIAVEENKGPLKIEVFRSGDLNVPSSVICWTKSGGAKGDADTSMNPDFISRTKSPGSAVFFAKGVPRATCEIDIIDDALYENAEDFYVFLSEPSANSALGAITKLKVIISGYNDVSLIYFSQEEFNFKENSGTVELPITRVGPDLSYRSSVWCTTQAVDAHPNEDYVPISQQVVFERGESESWCRLTLVDDSADPMLEGPERLHVILSSPDGSSLSEPSKAVVVIDDTLVDIPTFEFVDPTLIVAENDSEALVVIARHGDTRTKASVKCFTRHRSAKPNEDFVDRPRSEESRVFFNPGQERTNCTVILLDDAVFEGEEEFILGLADPLYGEGEQERVALIGDRAMIRVYVADKEDTPKITFERKFIVVDDDEHESKTVTVRLNREGDISAPSTILVKTRDGSAKSGSDYHPISRRLTIPANSDHAEINVTIYPSNSEDSREERFYVTINFHGNESHEIAIIVRTRIHEAIVLPSQPVVVSLLNYDNASSVLGTKPSPGYPLVCITPCEERHPHYQSTKILCEGKNMTIHFFWEIATPNEWHPLRYNAFRRLSKATIFTEVEEKVLDPIHFNSHFNVRCGVQPMKLNGRMGIPIKSQHVTIGASQGICKRDDIFEESHVQSHTLNANLFYVNASAERNPNTVHIKIEIPHSDGMIPLISTQPLHNAQTLLTSPLYIRHHTCSNLLVDSAFLKQAARPELQMPWPYQLDVSLRGRKTVEMYGNLDIRSCLWKFNAWFHMTELLDFCHGKVISEFKVADGGKNQMTIEVPLFVSYVTSSGAEEWTSVEHRTAMEVSFLYSPLAWHKGLQTEAKHSAKVKVTRVSANENGQIVIEFTSHALFRGHFILTNHKHKSSLMPPREMASLTFKLDLLWSETTWDGPRQQWRATSDSSRPDYSGLYHLMMVPCTVAQNTQYSIGDKHKKCTSHQPVQFPLNVNFKVPARPVPARYSLQTEFQITNNPKQFLATPDEETYVNDEAWQFSPGEVVYGKVRWHPAQDLKDAYRLAIDRVLLCAAKDGAELLIDPAGEFYGRGTQIGCLQPSKMLAHRFVLLDRENSEMADTEVQGVSFDAHFAKEVAAFAKMESLPGIDGFMWKVDPLYRINSGQEWLLQVLYRIRTTNLGRLKRSEPQWQQGYVAKGLKLMPLESKETGWPSHYYTVVACSASAAFSVIVALIARTAFRNSYTVTTPVGV